MKKITVALGSIALICLLTVSVLAGDLPEVVKTDTSIDVMLCRVEAESEDEMTVEVLRAERTAWKSGNNGRWSGRCFGRVRKNSASRKQGTSCC